MYMYTCIYVSVYICICGNMCICAYAYVCICIYTYTNCMYIYVCVHMIHAYMYVYLEGLESSTYACSSCVCMSARMHRCSDNMQGALQIEHPAEVRVCVCETHMDFRIVWKLLFIPSYHTHIHKPRTLWTASIVQRVWNLGKVAM